MVNFSGKYLIITTNADYNIDEASESSHIGFIYASTYYDALFS